MQIDFKPALLVIATGLIGGCSSFESVPPPEGDDEYVFETLSSEENFERKELRIRCSEAADSAR